MATIKISGMRCGHCVGAVTNALASIKGISDVTVDLEKSQATFTESEPIDASIIKAAITKLGFEVTE